MAINRLLRIGVALVMIGVVSWQTADRAVACDPWPTTMVMMRTTNPGDANAYARGDLGVVQPTYMRRFLVQAYRRFVGVAPSGLDPATTQPFRYGWSSETIDTWLKARTSVASGPPKASYQVMTWRTTGNTGFLNCLDDAFLVAARTLDARVREFGASHPAVLDWLRAQDVVFNNCHGDQDAEPPAVPASFPEIFKKDRDYQIAAAHFYAMRYAEAEQRFTAISSDASSPWRPYGAYLAARAMTRRAGLAAPDATERATLFRRADERFAAVAAGTSPTAKSAEDLRSFVATHADPVARMHRVAMTLATSADAADQDFIDFSALFDRVVDPQVRYSYNTVARAAVTRSDDLTDWILALQGDGQSAAVRALERWSATHSVPWLVAALWRAGPNDPQAPALLTEAAQLPRESPASATVSFLRVRLLMARDARPAARELLGTLPDAEAPGFPPDAINLIRAQRLQLAQTFEESMRAAPRLPVAEIWSGSVEDAEQHPPYTKPVFDIDGARLLSEGLPMSRLIDAASGSLLPERLGAFVAAATWVRAVQLRDDHSGLAAASQLAALTPALAEDMRRYTTAPDAESRHRSGLLTLVNWPGLRNYVRLTESAASYGGEWPTHDIDGSTPQNWWCGFERNHHFRLRGPYEERPVTPLLTVLGVPASDPAPSYLTSAERQSLQSEMARLTALGPAPNYFVTEALAWAAASPKDEGAAQALALAVGSTKYGCGNDATGALSRRAFTVLHKQFPASAWAKRTPYWFKGWGGF